MCCDFLVEYCELFLIAICNFSLFFITMVRKKQKKKQKMERERSISEIDFENKFSNFFE